jgi:HEPN domain-containing protein
LTTHELAAAYLRKCQDRLAALNVLMARKAFSDVVRESQETVELALKGILRAVGIDPPKWHDVGDLLLEFESRLPMLSPDTLRELATASRRLRKEREFSFYGDVDFIPTEAYGQSDADYALAAAHQATAALEKTLAH